MPFSFTWSYRWSALPSGPLPAIAAETRLKMSESQKRMNEERRRLGIPHASSLRKGAHLDLSPEQRQRRAKRAALRPPPKHGTPHTAETKARLSAIARVRTKHSMTGRKHSAETLAKMRATAKARGVFNHSGLKRSEETKARMSAAQATRRRASKAT